MILGDAAGERVELKQYDIQDGLGIKMLQQAGILTAIVTGRESPNSLYSMKHVTFEDDQGAYDQFDAQGFIKLNALRLRRAPARN